LILLGFIARKRHNFTYHNPYLVGQEAPNISAQFQQAPLSTSIRREAGGEHDAEHHICDQSGRL
jgi:hypothetical protein